MNWDGYAESRKHLRYYAKVKALIDELGPLDSILDVGCGATPTATYGQFKQRYAVNLEPCEVPGVRMIIGDFLHTELPQDSFDVVTCLQVLEHISDSGLPSFTSRLRSIAKLLIVSVPYKWPKGMCVHHYQDPIDEAKLERMLGVSLDYCTTITEDDGVQRLLIAHKLKA